MRLRCNMQRGRIQISADLSDWFENAPAYPQVRIINMTSAIAIQSTSLMDNTHRNRLDRVTDPSNQTIIATAIINDCPLVTSDGKIVEYPDVQTIF